MVSGTDPTTVKTIDILKYLWTYVNNDVSILVRWLVLITAGSTLWESQGMTTVKIKEKKKICINIAH